MLCIQAGKTCRFFLRQLLHNIKRTQNSNSRDFIKPYFFGMINVDIFLKRARFKKFKSKILEREILGTSNGNLERQMLPSTPITMESYVFTLLGVTKFRSHFFWVDRGAGESLLLTHKKSPKANFNAQSSLS